MYLGFKRSVNFIMSSLFFLSISEILSSQRPGQRPIQIHQRPFHTRIKITKTKLPPPFAAGIPLPEVLIPGFEMPTTPQG